MKYLFTGAAMLAIVSLFIGALLFAYRQSEQRNRTIIEIDSLQTELSNVLSECDSIIIVNRRTQDSITKNMDDALRLVRFKKLIDHYSARCAKTMNRLYCDTAMMYVDSSDAIFNSRK